MHCLPTSQHHLLRHLTRACPCPAHSGAMLAGDAVAPTSSWLGGLGGGLQVEPHAAPAEAAAQRAAAKRLIMQASEPLRECPCMPAPSVPSTSGPPLLQGGFEWLLPMHGGNFSREQAQALVQSWPDEAPQPEAGQAAEQQGGADGGDAGAAMVGEEQVRAAGGDCTGPWTIFHGALELKLI